MLIVLHSTQFNGSPTSINNRDFDQFVQVNDGSVIVVLMKVAILKTLWTTRSNVSVIILPPLFLEFFGVNQI